MSPVTQQRQGRDWDTTQKNPVPNQQSGRHVKDSHYQGSGGLLYLQAHDGRPRGGVRLFMKPRCRVSTIEPALQRSELDGMTTARNRTRTTIQKGT
jgi:hypothetical protein